MDPGAGTPLHALYPEDMATFTQNNQLCNINGSRTLRNLLGIKGPGIQFLTNYLLAWMPPLWVYFWTSINSQKNSSTLGKCRKVNIFAERLKNQLRQQGTGFPVAVCFQPSTGNVSFPRGLRTAMKSGCFSFCSRCIHCCVENGKSTETATTASSRHALPYGSQLKGSPDHCLDFLVFFFVSQ